MLLAFRLTPFPDFDEGPGIGEGNSDVQKRKANPLKQSFFLGELQCHHVPIVQRNGAEVSQGKNNQISRPAMQSCGRDERKIDNAERDRSGTTQLQSSPSE